MDLCIWWIVDRRKKRVRKLELTLKKDEKKMRRKKCEGKKGSGEKVKFLKV